MNAAKQHRFENALKEIWQEQPALQSKFSADQFRDLFPLIWTSDQPDEPAYPEDMELDEMIFEQVLESFNRIFDR